MAPFVMCPACQAEYDDPEERRFHAQPNACPDCGPRLTLIYAAGNPVPGEPLTEAVRLLQEGAIVAVKSTGGYHLAVDAANDTAVRELRRRKLRDEKPFAVMAAGLEEIREFARPDPFEERLIASPERPIVLIRQRDGHPLSPSVAPANDYFGVMLPATPLHHLLLRGNFTALVMTSGNLSDEPIAYRDEEARERLGEIAGFFLAHDRGIHTRVDDSVIRVFQGNPLFLRRSRGYAPRAIPLPAVQRNVLAVGAELKGAVCLTRGDRAFMSQHIGDLKNPETLASLEVTAAHLGNILEIEPEIVAHDLHPDYLSTRFAEGIQYLPKVGVQHHHAHLAACMAENRLEGEVIGIIFDGTGYGPDGTVWGGEFLVGGYYGYRRVGHLRQVPLPGGDAAVREPYRMALAWLRETYGPTAFDLPLPFVTVLSAEEKRLFDRMMERGVNSPLTSSCGRLFDAVAALLGIRTVATYEGQAAIELEGLAERGASLPALPFGIDDSDDGFVVDFTGMFRELTGRVLAGDDRASLARAFHVTIATAAAEVCDRIRVTAGMNRVVLSGGVFQNKLLAEGIHDLLTARDFQVFTHRLVPPNDGGLALGQAIIAGRSPACA
jgi:hydrogenase maturation protein HypF